MDPQRYLGLRTVIYKVSDIAQAKDWYGRAFETAPYFDEPFYVGFEISGYELGLSPEKNGANNKSESVLAYWGVEDVVKEFERLTVMGAIAHEAPQNVGGGIIVASVKDPWGNIIGLIFNPHFNLASR